MAITPPDANLPKKRTGEPMLPETAAKLNELLASLWSRSRSTIAERLEVLRHAQRMLEIDSGNQQARDTGVDAAHKLAGILGTFGLPRGTDLARQAELLLHSEAPLLREHVIELKTYIDELEGMIQRKSLDGSAAGR